MRNWTTILFTSLILAVPLTGNAEENESPFQYDEKSPFHSDDKPTTKENQKPVFKTDNGPTFKTDDRPPVPRPKPAISPSRTAETVSRLKRRPTVSGATTNTVAARLIHERALMQARHRRARIQTRKWTGKSLLRPLMTGERPSPADAHAVWSPTHWGAAERYRMYWHSK